MNQYSHYVVVQVFDMNTGEQVGRSGSCGAWWDRTEIKLAAQIAAEQCEAPCKQKPPREVKK